MRKNLPNWPNYAVPLRKESVTTVFWQIWFNRLNKYSNQQSRNTVKYIYEFWGHPSARKTENTIKKYFNIKGVSNILNLTISKCRQCQVSKICKADNEQLTRTLQTNKPFKHISADIYNPVPTYEFSGLHKHTKFWVLTITDRCTR